MNSRTLLKRAVGLTTLVFSLFGGFFTSIAPPESQLTGVQLVDDAKTASIVLLLILIIIMGIVVNLKISSKIWLIIGVIFIVLFIGSLFHYKSIMRENTFAYFDSTTVIKGDILLPEVEKFKTKYKSSHNGEAIRDANLLAKYGGLEHESAVWAEDSIRINETNIVHNYQITMALLAIGLFSILEGAIKPTAKGARKTRSSTKPTKPGSPESGPN